jgi:hypothetical protein
VTVSLRNNANQALSIYYYEGGKEKLLELPPNETTSLVNIDSLSPSTDRLVSSKYLMVVYSSTPTQTESTPINVNGMAWAGKWNQNVNYLAGYVVGHFGSIWLSKKSSKNNEPALLNTDWELIGVQDLNSLLGVDQESVTAGSIIYRTEFGWSAGPISDDSINGLISIGKINGLPDALNEKLSKSSGSAQTITSQVNYTGPISGVDSIVNKNYVDQMLQKSGGTMTGAILYDSAIAINNAFQLVTKAYVDNQLTTFIPTSGNVTMSGPLTLYGPPINPSQAATKAYVDARALAGGTLTGKLKLPTPLAISDATDLTNKAYVDARAVAGGILTGKLQLPTGFSISDATDLTNKAYVDARALAGGTLTGKLKLPIALSISENEDVPNKLYVDSAILNTVQKSGGTLTGLLYYRIPKTDISATASTDIFFKESHGLKAGRAVSATVLPQPGFGGITAGQTYYVVAVDSNRFKLASTFGNSTIGEADSTQLTTSSTEGLYVGQPITGTGFASGTVISSIDGPTTFTISIPLEQQQPKPIDITSNGSGASFVYVDQRSDDSIPSKDYIDDLLGVSGEVLLISGGEMSGPITGNHGLLQTDGGKPMSGAIVLASLPDTSVGTWTIQGFSVHSETETRVYLENIQDWKSYHDIQISSTTQYNGTYEVVEVNTEESFLVIAKEFVGAESSGTATQLTGGFYYSTSEGSVSYRRRKFLTKGSTVLVEADHEIQAGEGTILSVANEVSLIDLKDPSTAEGPVTIKKVGSAIGSSAIINSGGDGRDSNLVLDTADDAVTLEPIRENPGVEPPVFKWRVVSRVRNGENLNRVVFKGSILVSPGRTDIDITSNRNFEKTTKASAVANSSGNLEITVADATTFTTANLITIEGSVSGYNGNYSKDKIISVNTGTNKIVLANINAVSTIVNESGFFLVANVYEPLKLNLAAGSSVSPSSIRSADLSAKIAGFSNAGSGFTNIIIGNNVTVNSIENDPDITTGVSCSVADTLSKVFHGFSNGDKVTIDFSDGFAGLVVGDEYYVVNANADDFQLSLSVGGSAVSIGTGTDASITNFTKVSGRIKVILDETEFAAFHPDPNDFLVGDRVNIQWDANYNGSYLIESFQIPNDDTPPAVVIAKNYSVAVSGAKLSKAVSVSDWLPGYHSLEINGTTYYDTTPLAPALDLIATDDVYGILTVKATYASLEPSPTTQPIVYGMTSNNIFEHPSTFGKVLSGEGGNLVTLRTDGDGDLTLRMANKTLVSESSTNIADISRELSGSYLHMISGGVFDVVGKASGSISGVNVYSSSITSGGTSNILTLQNVLDFRIRDVVQLTGESITRRVTAVTSTSITVSGTAYTVSGASSVTNLSVIQLVLNDLDTNVFSAGDQVLLKGITSLGSDSIRTTVSAAAPLVSSPYTAPRVTLRGFNKTSANDTNTTDPIVEVTSSNIDDSLTFLTPHNLITGQMIRLEFPNEVVSGMTLTTNPVTTASVYVLDVSVIKTGAYKIQVAANTTNAYSGIAITVAINGSIGSVIPLVTVENPFDDSESVEGTIEIPSFLSLYTVKPWAWLSWNSIFSLSGSNITSWGDYSGNSRSFTAAANFPTIKDGSTSLLSFNGVTGIKCAAFTSSQAISLAITKSQAITIMFVAKTSATNGVIFESDSVNLTRGASAYTLNGTSGTLISGGTPGTGAAVYTVVLNGTSSRFRKFTSFSSSPQEVTGNITGGFTTNVTIGKTSGGFAGDMAAFMIYETVLTDDQISFLERSLAYEHGIS